MQIVCLLGIRREQILPRRKNRGSGLSNTWNRLVVFPPASQGFIERNELDHDLLLGHGLCVLELEKLTLRIQHIEKDR